jgi:D-alanyl-D-alanine carboxypeptidase (penicillin-binding protein 5/6)
MKKLTLFIATVSLSLNILAAPETTAATAATPTLPEPAMLKNVTAAAPVATPATATPTTPKPISTTAASSSAANRTAPMPAAPTLAATPTPTATTPTPQPLPNKPIPTLNTAKTATPVTPVPPVIDAKGYLLIDADSGYVIAQKNQDTPMPPASLTKLMTMYVVSSAMKEGRIHMTDNVPISENAWRTGGSRMFVKVGTQVPAQDLINGIIVASGNDACVAMAEFVAGSEHSFVDLMNKVAVQLGMKNTHYADATGLPDPQNYTTPYDLSILARAIIYHYPEDYKWYSQKWMSYNNIKQPNRNLLLFRDPTVDGLKTGHTDEAGYCLVASAKRNNNMRLIAVVMGSASMKQRATDAGILLNYGFRFFETHQLYAANTVLSKQRVWFGAEKETEFGLAQNLYVTIPIGQYDKLKATLSINPKIKAPVVKEQAYGQAQVVLNNQVIATQPLVALTDNPLGGFFSRLMDYISSWFN